MDIKNLPDENSKRFVAVLNQKISLGNLLNALGHMTAGLVGNNQNPKNFYFLDYQDKNKNIHSGISHFPYIVLKAENSNQIRKLRQQLTENKISFTDFTSTMTIGTSEDQLKATSEKNEGELEYYGICFFGETDKLKEITKKFSLFK